MKKYILHLFLFFAVMVIPSLAMADENCTDLDKNEQWMNGLTELSSLYSAGNYDQLIKKGKSLLDICSVSPTLNYFIAKAYHEKGDAQKELYYLQIGTRNSQHMEVSADVLEKMWKDRIYLEYPEVSPNSVEQLKIENQQLKSKMMSDNLNAIDDNSEMVFHYKTMMWSGVGIGSTGLVMLAAGAALVALQKDSAVEFDPSDNPTRARAGAKYVAGWSLLGAGIAATVVGATLSGLFAYYLTTTKPDDTISLNLSPFSAEMTIHF